MWARAQLYVVQSKPLWKAVLGKTRGPERGRISEASSGFLVVFQLLSCVRLFGPHGLQHTRLPCQASSAEFNTISHRRLESGCRVGFFSNSSWPAPAPWGGGGHWPSVFESPVALGGWQDVAVLLSLLYREEQREGWVAGQHLTSAALCFLLPCADPGMLCAFCCPVPIQGCSVLSAALCRSRDRVSCSTAANWQGTDVWEVAVRAASRKVTKFWGCPHTALLTKLHTLKLSSSAGSLHSSLENVIRSLWNMISHLPFLHRNWST